MTTEKRFTEIISTQKVIDNQTGKEYDCLIDDNLLKILNELHEENQQLQERNDRQAKRLAELYELMAKKDWESLTEIIDDFKRCEEQLQRESGTYGDVE